MTGKPRARHSAGTDGGRSLLGAGEVFGATLALTTLAIAHPVLDLLGRNAAFFVARGAPWGEPVGLALALAVVLPSLIVAVVLLVRGIDRRAGWLVHLAVVGALVALLTTQVLDSFPLADGLGVRSLVAVGLVIGAGGALAYWRSSTLRSALALGWIAPLAACGLFLFVSPVAGFVLPSAVAGTGPSSPTLTPPVVMIVLDELPVTSLMRGDGQIDDELFPTFARLAEEGTWYRNATTVDTFTTQSVPAILTGNYPEPEQLAIAGDHPDTLFELLGGVYDVHALESVTQLCSEDVCAEELAPHPTIGQRLRSLGLDVGIVGAHVLVPEDLRDRLPPISDAWGEFGESEAPAGDAPEVDRDAEPDAFLGRFHEAVDSDRRDDFRRLREALRANAEGDRPSLYFLHTLLPHTPWEYLPSGDRYQGAGTIPGYVEDGWNSDEWLSAQGYQRHLLQTSMTDSLIGDVLAELEALDRYDETLVVVTSDHGVTFTNGRDRRWMESDTIGDIAAIPLFIKYPQQQHVGIVDDPVESVDIAATILDVLDVTGAGPTDGRSLLDLDAAKRQERRISQRGTVMSIPADSRHRDDVLARKVALFGRQGGLDELYSFGPHGDLVGRELAELEEGAASPLTIGIDQWDALADLDPAAERVPARITGTVTSAEPLGDARYLAVVLGEQVRAIGKTFAHQGRRGQVSVMLPAAALTSGSGDVRLFEVADDVASGVPTLRPIDVHASG